MLKIEINVSRKCIQGGAKRAYENRISQCLKAPLEDLDVLEQEVEALKTFLEKADFPALRSAHSALAGGQEAVAVLLVFSSGGFEIEVAGEKVVLPKT